MIYLYLKDGRVENYPDKELPLKKYGLKKPLAEIDEKTWEEAQGQARIIDGKLVIGQTQTEKDESEATKNRDRRDALLVETDKYLLSDYPIDAALLSKVKTYRQLLRDLPTAKEWPYIKKWPLNPVKK